MHENEIVTRLDENIRKQKEYHEQLIVVFAATSQGFVSLISLLESCRDRIAKEQERMLEIQETVSRR